MSHPKHPATVHFPIAFTLLTGILDAGYYAYNHPSTSSFVASGLKTFDIQLDPTTFPVLSYYTTLLTILFSLPAVVTGALELMPVIKRDGLGSRKAQTGVLHALINDLTVFGAAYNYWTRREAVGFHPSDANVLISAAVALPATMFAAYLGGSLVYVYGMGVGRGQARSKKGQ